VDALYNIDIMTIKLSLLSVVSTAILLSFLISGNDVSLDALCVDFVMADSITTIAVHPTWEVLVPKDYVFDLGCHAYAYGNVMVVGDHITGYHGDYIRIHERIHLAQFRALGWLMWPAQYVLPIEPPSNIQTDWTDMTQPARTMWAPPNWWPYKWSFITLRFG